MQGRAGSGWSKSGRNRRKDVGFNPRPSPASSPPSLPYLCFVPTTSQSTSRPSVTKSNQCILASEVREDMRGHVVPSFFCVRNPLSALDHSLCQPAKHLSSTSQCFAIQAAADNFIQILSIIRFQMNTHKFLEKVLSCPQSSDTN